MTSAIWGRLALSTFAVGCGGEAAAAVSELRHRPSPHPALAPPTPPPSPKVAAICGSLAAGLLSLQVPRPVVTALWRQRSDDLQTLRRTAAVMRVCRASLAVSLGLSFVAGVDHSLRVVK